MSHDEREGSRAADRDAEVTREWHRASVEQPPSSLDAALIAAARQAVEHEHASVSDARAADGSRLAHDVGPQSRTHDARSPLRRWMKWQPLAAAAAVAGIAFVLVPLLPRDHPLTPPDQRPGAVLPQSDATAEGPATPVESANEGALASPPPREAPNALASPALPPAAHESVERREILQSRPQDVPAPAPAEQRPPQPSDATPSSRPWGSKPLATMSAPATENAAAGEMQKKAATAEMPARAAAGNAADTAQATGRAAQPDDTSRPESRDPATWIAEITTLHDSGDVAGAAAALRAFRAAYPDADAQLPASLRAWAATVH